jgi:hypothetical protein
MPLSFVTFIELQKLELFGCFDAFGYHVDAEVPRQENQRPNNRSRPVVGAQLTYKCTVNFDAIRSKFPQAGE